MKNCIRPPYKKLKSLKSGFIENSNFENNRGPCLTLVAIMELLQSVHYTLKFSPQINAPCSTGRRLIGNVMR